MTDRLFDSLIVVNRLGVTGRYPANLDRVLEQYTDEKARKILNETEEILTWLIAQSSKR